MTGSATLQTLVGDAARLKMGSIVYSPSSRFKELL